MKAEASAPNGSSPGRTVIHAQPVRLFRNASGQGRISLSAPPAPGQRIAFSADNTPACATDDFPTPDAPMRIGSRAGFSLKTRSVASVSATRPKK